MLNFDSDVDANANADVKCEQNIKTDIEWDDRVCQVLLHFVAILRL